MQLRNLSQRVKRRRRQRGIALVEGAIVSTVLIIVLASGVYLHRVYALKLAAMREARVAAWTTALAGCSDEFDFFGTIRGLLTGGQPADPRDFVVRTPLGVVRRTRTRTTTAPAQLGAAELELSGSVTVACNEVVQSHRGDLLDLLGYYIDNLLPLSK